MQRRGQQEQRRCLRGGKTVGSLQDVGNRWKTWQQEVGQVVSATSMLFVQSPHKVVVVNISLRTKSM